jgi:hypothetical protein
MKKRDLASFRERWYETVNEIINEPDTYKNDDILAVLEQLLKELESLPSLGELYED